MQVPERQQEPADANGRNDPICPACDYNLRGLTSDRCPECGRDVTAVLQGQPAIPWLERDRLGLLTAYWRTVWLVTFRPRRLSRMIANPGSERDARRFRAMTLAHIAAAVLVLDVTVFVFFATVWKEIVYAIAPWYVAAWHVSFSIGLIVFTSAPWYAIDSRRITPEQSLPAAILGFYTGGVLAWSLALVLPLALAAAAREHGLPDKLTLASLMVAGVYGFLLFALMAWLVDRLIKLVSKGILYHWLSAKHGLLIFVALFITIGLPNVLLYLVVLVRSFS